MKVPIAKLYAYGGGEILLNGKNILHESLQSFRYEFEEGKGDKCQIICGFAKLEFNLKIFEPGCVYKVRWGYVKNLSNARSFAISDFKLNYSDSGYMLTITGIPISDYLDKNPISCATLEEELIKRAKNGVLVEFAFKDPKGTNFNYTVYSPKGTGPKKEIAFSKGGIPINIPGYETINGSVLVEANQRFYNTYDPQEEEAKQKTIEEETTSADVQEQQERAAQANLPSTSTIGYGVLPLDYQDQIKKMLRAVIGPYNDYLANVALQEVQLYIPTMKIDTRDNKMVFGIPNREAPAQFVAMPGRNIIDLVMKKREISDDSSANSGVTVGLEDKSITESSHEIRTGTIFTKEGSTGQKVEFIASPDQIWIQGEDKLGGYSVLANEEEEAQLRESFKRSDVIKKELNISENNLIQNNVPDWKQHDIFVHRLVVDEEAWDFAFRNGKLSVEDVKSRLRKVRGGFTQEEFVNQMIALEMEELFHTMEATVTMEGNPGVEAHMDLNFLLNGVNPNLDGKYHVEKVVHNLGKEYVTIITGYRIDYDIIARKKVFNQQYQSVTGLDDEKMYAQMTAATNELKNFQELIDRRDKDLGYGLLKWLHPIPTLTAAQDTAYWGPTMGQPTYKAQGFEVNPDYNSSTKPTQVPDESMIPEAEGGVSPDGFENEPPE